MILILWTPLNGMAQWPCASTSIEEEHAELSITKQLDKAAHCAISGCCPNEAIQLVQNIDTSGLNSTNTVRYLMLQTTLGLADDQTKQRYLHRSLQLLPSMEKASIGEKELLLWNHAELARYYLAPFNADSIGHHWQIIQQLLDEGIGDIALQAMVSMTLTNHYSILGQIEEALFWSFKTLKLSKDSPLKFEATAYVNLAYLLYDAGKLDSAYHYANIGYEKTKDEGSPIMATRAAGVMGFIAHDRKNMTEYVRLSKMALNSSFKTKDATTIANCYQQYANALFHTDKFHQAIEMAEKGVKYDPADLTVMYELYRVLTLAAEKNHNDQLALRYHKRLYEYQDSLTNMNQAEILAEVNERYESEKKDREIALLQAQRSEAEWQAQWRLLVSLVTVLAILIISGMVVIGSMKKKQMAQQKLHAYQRQLDGELMKATSDERERISRILHDTVAGSLSGMTYMTQHLSMLENEPKKQKSKLNEIGKQLNVLYQQVRNLSHELMPFQLSTTEDFSDQLAEFLEQRAKQLQDQTLTYFLDHEIELNNLSPKNRSLVFTFVQEALHNAVRHSKAKQINVESWTDANQLGIRISDNGIGMAKKANGIGLKSMQFQAKKEGATIKTTEPLGGGTAIELILG